MADYWSQSWSKRPYRGETSMNLPEMIGLTNKDMVIVGAVFLALFGAVALAVYMKKRREAEQLPVGGFG